MKTELESKPAPTDEQLATEARKMETSALVCTLAGYVVLEQVYKRDLFKKDDDQAEELLQRAICSTAAELNRRVPIPPEDDGTTPTP